MIALSRSWTLSFIVVASLILSGFVVPVSTVKADQTSFYCTKYFCAYVTYTRSSTTRYINERFYDGSNGCFNSPEIGYECGALKWRLYYYNDSYRYTYPNGPGNWEPSYSYQFGPWYSNAERQGNWRCVCAPNTISASDVRIRARQQLYEYDEDTNSYYYWYEPFSAPVVWYI